MESDNPPIYPNKPYKYNNKRPSMNPSYRSWKTKVYKRDGYQCQWPGCKERQNLNAHHIYKYRDHPHLRYTVKNGITLCEKHHDHVTNRESKFIRMFLEIVFRKS
jgi:5-methylcytosine-specific restriction endonuclease McrA